MSSPGEKLAGDATGAMPAGGRDPAALDRALEQAGGLYDAGELGAAERLCRQVLERQPAEYEALNLLGIIAARTQRPGEALQVFERALAGGRAHAFVHSNYGNVLKDLGRLEEALASYDRALATDPDFAEAHYNRGVALHATGRFEEALQAYERARVLRPNHARTHHYLGLTLAALRRHEAALEHYERSLRIDPHAADCYGSRGDSLYALGRFPEALASYRHLLRIEPANARAYDKCGNALQCQGRLEEALIDYRRALELRPDFAVAWYNSGMAQRKLARLAEALESHERAVQLDPALAEAWYGRALVLHALHRPEAALESLDRSLALAPECAEVHERRGALLQELRRHEEALAAYNRVLQLDPRSWAAHNNSGIALFELKRLPQALESYARALEIGPQRADTYYNRALALQQLGRYDAALADLDQSLRLNPAQPWARGMRLHVRARLCRWSRWQEELQELKARISAGEPATPPFFAVTLLDCPLSQYQAARQWVRATWPPGPLLPALAQRPAGARIRLGYYSADYHEHATSSLVAELFESHRREEFELVGFSLGHAARDPMRARLERAFDRFVDVCGNSDLQIAQLSRQLGIDIAVDLKGFTEEARPGIFAHRAAPLQVSYLGYPGTMAAPYVDYLIADRTLVPETLREHYAEKLVYLPDTYQINDRQRPIAPREWRRSALGLPEHGFVFCCFNNCYKITPQMFDSWMRVLTRVEGSVLWLLAELEPAAVNLRCEAEARGVSRERLIFAPHIGRAEHLARYRMADLFLDTFPCNAHTTASDALWVGLPVLTRQGESFAARVAGSLLQAAGLPELITTGARHYEEVAVALATDPGRLAELRRRLRERRLQLPLFDSTARTRQLEEAYRRMYARYQAQLAPEHLVIDSV